MRGRPVRLLQRVGADDVEYPIRVPSDLAGDAMHRDAIPDLSHTALSRHTTMMPLRVRRIAAACSGATLVSALIFSSAIHVGADDRSWMLGR